AVQADDDGALRRQLLGGALDAQKRRDARAATHGPKIDQHYLPPESRWRQRPRVQPGDGLERWRRLAEQGLKRLFWRLRLLLGGLLLIRKHEDDVRAAGSGFLADPAVIAGVGGHL